MIKWQMVPSYSAPYIGDTPIDAVALDGYMIKVGYDNLLPDDRTLLMVDCDEYIKTPYWWEPYVQSYNKINTIKKYEFNNSIFMELFEFALDWFIENWNEEWYCPAEYHVPLALKYKKEFTVDRYHNIQLLSHYEKIYDNRLYAHFFKFGHPAFYVLCPVNEMNKFLLNRLI